ncbi:DUF2946 domain-containing protein [Hydrogenophaga sp. NFH-34]|uniref:DUF2946 domain-containing protein n=1 Tax=Hydrogenophaga sp. NFH-34 TaxID=2744446 RepID=UPI002DD43E9C|nr:DUF2946 domain-containing protein [Hydrogenophaga sp. NFH-34]
MPESWRTGRRLHRRIARLLLWAMILGALAPAISQARAAQRGIDWVDICTDQGVLRVALPADDGTPTAPKAALNEHCGYCILQHHTPVLPSAAALLPLAGALNDRVRVGGGHTTGFKRLERKANPPRAPPRARPSP